MPYEIVHHHPDCSGYAVVKEDSAEMMGCHSTMQEAQDQMAALYADEPMMEAKGRSEGGDRPETKLPAKRSELRSVFTAELREVNIEPSGNGKDLIFTGSPIVFNSWSELLWTPKGYFRERVLPEALDEILPFADVELNYNHNEDSIMARTSSGTLDISADNEETRVWSRLDLRDPDVQRLRPKMERGDVKWMSFSFEMDGERGAADRWYEDEETGEVRRDIIKVSDLFDVSIVGRPAYTATSAELRSLEAAAAAGKITLPTEPVAQAEIDPADTQTDPASAQAETDPAVGEDRDASAQAETDPAVGGLDALTKLRTDSSETVRAEKEQYLGLLREIAHATHKADRGGS